VRVKKGGWREEWKGRMEKGEKFENRERGGKGGRKSKTYAGRGMREGVGGKGEGRLSERGRETEMKVRGRWSSGRADSGIEREGRGGRGGG